LWLAGSPECAELVRCSAPRGLAICTCMDQDNTFYYGTPPGHHSPSQDGSAGSCLSPILLILARCLCFLPLSSYPQRKNFNYVKLDLAHLRVFRICTRSHAS
jgi:hypothetical protein